jgi:hypothetical protein
MIAFCIPSLRSATWLVGAGACATMAVACGSNNNGGGFPEVDGGEESGSITGGDGGADSSTGQGGGDGGVGLVGDGSVSTPETSAPAPVPVVYAQSADTLYRLDPTNTQVAVVGPFSGGCSSVIDLAIDSSSNAYVTTSSDLWKLDLTTAACTHISSGSYPNSLSFVPKGTVDPNVEALVGYVGATYIHINTTTGAVTNVGTLSGGYTSSGDIVSVIGGGTFLTVKDGPHSCGDCLLQVDPTTGDLIQDYGSVSHTDVFGLAFWAGTAYGFDNAGEVFSIGWQNGALVTTDITVPNPPPMLSFWGAGSTTAAPPMSADGGGLPIQ